jgi:general stress protein 26
MLLWVSFVAATATATAACCCRVVQLVRAIRKGWLKTNKQRQQRAEEQQVYLLWGDDDQVSWVELSGAALSCTEMCETVFSKGHDLGEPGLEP